MSISADSVNTELFVHFASLAMKAERYGDMLKFVDRLVTISGIRGKPLSSSETNLLQTAYKQTYTSLRKSRLALIMAEKENENNRDDRHRHIATRIYREEIDSKIIYLCERIVNVLELHLIPLAKSETVKVLYLTLKGDFHRYVADVLVHNRNLAAEEAVQAYQEAQEITRAVLPASDKLRLNLALNFAVLYGDTMGQREQACHIAKQAFDEACDLLDRMKAPVDEVTAVILNKIKDNLIEWNPDLKVRGIPL